MLLIYLFYWKASSDLLNQAQTETKSGPKHHGQKKKMVPINIFNGIYKIVTKVLINHLKGKNWFTHLIFSIGIP